MKPSGKFHELNSRERGEDMREKSWETTTIYPVSLEISNAVAHFIEREKGEHEKNREEFFKWKLVNKNFKSSIVSVATPLSSSEIISTCSVTPKKFWLNGNLIVSAQIGDTYTSNEFQRRGIFGELVKEARISAYYNGIELIYGLPNEQSFPGYIKKLGFKEVKTVSLSKYICFISSNKRFVSHLLRQRGIFLANKMAVILNFAIRCLLAVFAFFQELTIRKSNKFVITEISTVISEFDEFWNKVSHGLSFAQVRDMNYIQHRYIENPYPFKINTVVSDQEMVGYFVTLDIVQAETSFMQKTVIVDWLINPNFGPELGFSILKTIIDGAKQRGSITVSSVHSDLFEQSLPFRQALFLKTKPKLPIIFHTKKISHLRDDCLKQWHFTMGDTDEF